jgi:predicted NBD/HSP70 family sugar kinase
MAPLVGTLRALPPPGRPSLDATLAFAWTRPGPFTAGDALPVVGLTRSTTIDAIDALTRLGLLRELPNARADAAYTRGRPARRFELAADAAVVVGVDAGRAHVILTLADLRGRPLVTRRCAVAGIGDEDEGGSRRRLLVTQIQEALAQTGRAADAVLAICVGVPAPVDREGASPPHRGGFWQAMNPDLRDLLEEIAPIVVVRNDSALAAVAEGSATSGGAAAGLDDYVTLLAGDRLGMGVVVDGHLLHGAHGGAGETKAFRHVQGVGSDEGLGVRIARWAREALAAPSTQIPGRGGDAPAPADHPLRALPPGQVTAREVLDLARRGDPVARSVEARAGELLARLAATIGSLYDPRRIVVSGAIAGALGGVIDVARPLVAGQLDLPAPELVASSLGADVVSVGAVRAAVDAARAGALHIG